MVEGLAWFIGLSASRGVHPQQPDHGDPKWIELNVCQMLLGRRAYDPLNVGTSTKRMLLLVCKQLRYIEGWSCRSYRTRAECRSLHGHETGNRCVHQSPRSLIIMGPLPCCMMVVRNAAAHLNIREAAIKTQNGAFRECQDKGSSQGSLGAHSPT